MSNPVVIEQDWTPKALSVQDGGQARIYQMEYLPDEENGLFVRLQSWDSTRSHEMFSLFEGKRIRITVEVIE